LALKRAGEEDGVDEEGKPKYKEIEVDNIINDHQPYLDKGNPSELKDQDYLNFYKEFYPFSEDPLVLDPPEC
jgi:molecular chaperone HtpG